MTFIAFLALPVLLTLLAVARLGRLIRDDGYGHRPPPPSHHEWAEVGTPYLPSRPYLV